LGRVVIVAVLDGGGLRMRALARTLSLRAVALGTPP